MLVAIFRARAPLDFTRGVEVGLVDILAFRNMSIPVIT
jgi:hypothetical protein